MPDRNVPRRAGGVDARLRAAGLELPHGDSLTTLTERPDLDATIDAHHAGMWEPFMLESAVAARAFPRAHADWPDHQLILLDAAGTVVATSNAMPLSWDGTDSDLPAGWDQQVIRSMDDVDARRPATALGAMLIVVGRSVREHGLARLRLDSMRTAARSERYLAVLACVRPTEKHRYP